jgi:hypothetical protein
MAMRSVTDHAGQAVRINPRHVTHVICFTERSPDDPETPERMGVGLVTGECLTFCYRSPQDASRAAQNLDTTASGRPATDTRALDVIASLLDGQEWDTETVSAIAEQVRATGRQARDIGVA